MRNKWARANSLGSNIDDDDFENIFLTSLPPSWSPIVAICLKEGSSTETISFLETWSYHFSPNKHHNPVAALQINKSIQKDQNQLICINPNSRRQGHTIEVCYWPGGGKEGQFLPGFGKRGGVRGSATNTQQGGFRPTIKANTISATEVPEEEELVFAFMTSDTHDLKVLATPVPTNDSPHNPIPCRSNKPIIQEGDGRGVLLTRFWSGEDPIVFRTQRDNISETATLIVSQTSFGRISMNNGSFLMI